MPRLNKFAQAGLRLTKQWEASVGDVVEAMSWAGGRVAVAAIEGPIHLLDSTSGASLAKFPGHRHGTCGVAFSASGAHLASVGQDGKIRFWDPDAGNEKFALDAGVGAAWAEHLAWSPREELLATAAGKKLRLWNPEGELVREFADHSHVISALAWSVDGSVLASASYGQIRHWTTEHSDPIREWTPKTSPICLAWSSDAKYLATGNQDDSVHFWIVAQDENLEMTGYSTKVKEISWDPTGANLATTGGREPCVWNCTGKGPEGTKPIVLKGHQDLVNVLAHQRAGVYLATGGEDGRVFLWNPAKQQIPIGKADLGSAITRLRWSADDRQIIVANAEGKVALFAVG